MGWLVGTRDSLVRERGDAWLEGREITALAPADDASWVLADGRDVVRIGGDAIEPVASIEEELGRSLLPVGDAILVGTANARLALARGGSVEMVASFDAAEDRERWYTPWGGPPDTRSLSASPDGSLFANVHVGGILRAGSPEGPWLPTIDIDTDVHQVLADPSEVRHVVAASALGLAESDDGGATWRFVTDGLHAAYARAVALVGRTLLMSASSGPQGGRAAVYRRDQGQDGFTRCTEGLPEWFGRNVDSHHVAAADGRAAFGAGDRLFVSDDAGVTWNDAGTSFGEITCVAFTRDRP